MLLLNPVNKAGSAFKKGAPVSRCTCIPRTPLLRLGLGRPQRPRPTYLKAQDTASQSVANDESSSYEEGCIPCWVSYDNSHEKV